MRGLTICTGLVVGFLLGCTGEVASDAPVDAPDDTDIDAPMGDDVDPVDEDTDKGKGKGKGKGKRDADTRPFAFEGWIGEGLPTLVAKSAASAPLFDGWRKGAKTGTCKVKAGDKLKIHGSMVITKKGNPLPIPHQGKVSGRTWGPLKVLTKDLYLDGKDTTIDLASTKSVVLVQARAEGECLYRVDGDVVETGCQAFTQTAELPKTEWWTEVQCDGGKGWVKVSDFGGKVTDERQF